MKMTFKNQDLLIGLGVAAVGYLVWRQMGKKGESAGEEFSPSGESADDASAVYTDDSYTSFAPDGGGYSYDYSTDAYTTPYVAPEAPNGAQGPSGPTGPSEPPPAPVAPTPLRPSTTTRPDLQATWTSKLGTRTPAPTTSTLPTAPLFTDPTIPAPPPQVMAPPPPPVAIVPPPAPTIQVAPAPTVSLDPVIAQIDRTAVKTTEFKPSVQSEPAPTTTATTTTTTTRLVSRR